MVLIKEEHIFKSENNENWVKWDYESFVKNTNAKRVRVTFEVVPEDVTPMRCIHE